MCIVYEDYIHVGGQYRLDGKYTKTKTKEVRNIPIIRAVYGDLNKLLRPNGDGYLFSENGGNTLVSRTVIRRNFNRAMNRIGIGEKEIARRRLTVHSWRHFFNSVMRYQGVSNVKVKSVTGHKSSAMVDRYNHCNTKDFEEMREVQQNVLAIPMKNNAKKAK